MPLRRHGAGKRELYEPVSFHPFSGVFVLRRCHFNRVWFSRAAPAKGPGQVHLVVVPVVSGGRHRDCLGNVPVFQVECFPSRTPVGTSPLGIAAMNFQHSPTGFSVMTISTSLYGPKLISG